MDIERVKRNVRQATTEDLLDRVTVYRAGMELQALDVIESELRQRGVTVIEIEDHQRQRQQETHKLPDGTVNRCTLCHRPAVAEGRGWYRMWGVFPLFPRFYRYCSVHRPDAEART